MEWQGPLILLFVMLLPYEILAVIKFADWRDRVKARRG